MSKNSHIFDVIVIGAGISGVSAGYHLKRHCPNKTFAILEARDAIGGTWDLFRYPGVRSDSDMFTLGFGFWPWAKAKAIADGPAIKNYVIDTAEEFGVTDHIRFSRRVLSMDWSSAKSEWNIRVDHNGAEEIYRCRFLISCAGYYRYSEGYSPEFDGVDDFKGQIVHPQHWPEDLEYSGKRVVVIGSGATAVTLVPAMAKKAKHVVMLQRSPSYYFSMPETSGFARALSRFLPAKVVTRYMRVHRAFFQQVTFKLARRFPKKTAENLIKHAQDRLPQEYDVDTHFTPGYDPWDQRICVVPNDDLFAAISNGSVSVVTDQVERFVESGIRTVSGDILDADIVVTATGLVLETFGGAEILVNGERQEPGKMMTYKGVMFEGLPNFVSVFGYTNASWTLRADLVNAYACRLINYLEDRNHLSVMPVNSNPALGREAFLDFTSGYVTRVAARLPKQGGRKPWRHPQDYLYDIMNLKYGRLDDGVLYFQSAPSTDRKAA